MLDVGGEEKAKFVKDLHIQVQERIRRKGEQVAQRVNNGHKKMVFQPGDWVWVHFLKISFPDKTKGKLAPRGDGPFLVLESVNDNAYVIDLPGEYNVSCTFNVADLSPYDFVGNPDLRTNPFQEGEDDTITTSLKALGGPTTRSISKNMLEDVSLLMKRFWSEKEARMRLGGGSKARELTVLETDGKVAAWSGPLWACDEDTAWKADRDMERPA